MPMEYELVSCHEVIIEDAEGEVVDVEYYCSDFCAKGSDDYAGRNGCNEVAGPQWCVGCGDKL